MRATAYAEQWLEHINDREYMFAVHEGDVAERSCGLLVRVEPHAVGAAVRSSPAQWW